MTATVISMRRPDADCREFTERELEILQAAADGGSYAKIAIQLGLTVGCVKNMACSILGKLEVESMTHAVATALRQGLID